MSKTEELLEKANKEIYAARKRRKEIKQNLPLFEALEQMFPTIYFSASYSYISINIHDAVGFTSCDNPGLLETFEKLEELGLSPVSSFDNPKNNCRQFEFKHPSGLVLYITVWLADDSICQRVITGYKEVEEEQTVRIKVAKPVYEFKC